MQKQQNKVIIVKIYYQTSVKVLHTMLDSLFSALEDQAYSEFKFKEKRQNFRLRLYNPNLD